MRVGSIQMPIDFILIHLNYGRFLPSCVGFPGMGLACRSTQPCQSFDNTKLWALGLARLLHSKCGQCWFELSNNFYHWQKKQNAGVGREEPGALLLRGFKYLDCAS